MLRFLLDEHIYPDVATTVTTLRQEIDVVSMGAWQGGTYIGQDDASIIAAAYDEGLALVTFDQATIPPLLVDHGTRYVPHAGVIFASTRTLPANDIGGIARALVRVWDEFGDLDWTNRVVYLAST